MLATGNGAWVHSEIHWQNDDGALRIRPDVVVFDPRFARALDDDGMLTFFKNWDDRQSASKRMSFGGPALAIEIKPR